MKQGVRERATIPFLLKANKQTSIVNNTYAARQWIQGYGRGWGRYRKKKPAENVFCMAFLCSWKGYPCLVPKTKRLTNLHPRK